MVSKRTCGQRYKFFVGGVYSAPSSQTVRVGVLLWISGSVPGGYASPSCVHRDFRAANLVYTISIVNDRWIASKVRFIRSPRTEVIRQTDIVKRLIATRRLAYAPLGRHQVPGVRREHHTLQPGCPHRSNDWVCDANQMYRNTKAITGIPRYQFRTPYSIVYIDNIRSPTSSAYSQP